MSKIAIIGGGIAGLVAARLLAPGNELTLFEAASTPGGHTSTATVDVGGERFEVDLGVIVYNERNYPRFTRLLAALGVATRATEMSFSVSCRVSGVEWKGHSLGSLFARRRNLVNPGFYRFLADVLRFHRDAKAAAREGVAGTVGELLARGGYGRRLAEQYVVPMGAALWSAPPASLAEFPAAHFVRFLDNHGMLDLVGRPRWRTVAGGSARYVERIVADLGASVRLSCPVRSLRRTPEGAEVRLPDGTVEPFDEVVLATHSDQALAMLEDPSREETEILGALPYQDNEVVLHTDESLLPRCRRAWAAWNVDLAPDPRRPVSVTYDMNILQGLAAPVTFCVSLNQGDRIAPTRVLRRVRMAHPVYTLSSERARARRAQISGSRHTWYCGAYWGSGFHEDGVESALAVTRAFGRELAS